MNNGELAIEQPVALQVASELQAKPDTSLIAVIAQAAADPRCDVEKMRALLDMQERILAKQAERAFFTAMRAAQEEMLPIHRDAQNNSNNSRYARLESVDGAVRPIYTRHGFSLSFNSESVADAIAVQCKVMHEGGHAENYALQAGIDMYGPAGKPNKTSVQGVGSSVSYLRRYLTIMIFNLALTNEDNDGAPRVGDNAAPEPTDNDAITLDQETILRDKLKEFDGGRGMSEERKGKFLKWLDIASLEEMKQRDFTRAMRFLVQRLKEENPTQ